METPTALQLAEAREAVRLAADAEYAERSYVAGESFSIHHHMGASLMLGICRRKLEALEAKAEAAAAATEK